MSSAFFSSGAVVSALASACLAIRLGGREGKPVDFDAMRAMAVVGVAIALGV
jgi:hypothetical protein